MNNMRCRVVVVLFNLGSDCAGKRHHIVFEALEDPKADLSFTPSMLLPTFTEAMRNFGEHHAHTYSSSTIHLKLCNR